MSFTLKQISGKSFLLTPTQLLLIEGIEYINEVKKDEKIHIDITMKNKTTTVFGITLEEFLKLVGVV